MLENRGEIWLWNALFGFCNEPCEHLPAFPGKPVCSTSRRQMEWFSTRSVDEKVDEKVDVVCWDLSVWLCMRLCVKNCFMLGWSCRFLWFVTFVEFIFHPESISDSSLCSSDMAVVQNVHTTPSVGFPPFRLFGSFWSALAGPKPWTVASLAVFQFPLCEFWFHARVTQKYNFMISWTD